MNSILDVPVYILTAASSSLTCSLAAFIFYYTYLIMVVYTLFRIAKLFAHQTVLRYVVQVRVESAYSYPAPTYSTITTYELSVRDLPTALDRGDKNLHTSHRTRVVSVAKITRMSWTRDETRRVHLSST